jgi:AcrR family transcriptional regulator
MPTTSQLLKHSFQLCQTSAVPKQNAIPSARQTELLELAYHYVLEHGLAELSLRPLASAIGSSPRVLLYLFDSKDGLVRALLNRSRTEETALLEEVRGHQPAGDLREVGKQLWTWLAAPHRRALLALWVEAYARSLTAPDSAWAGFAQDTVHDWLELLAGLQPVEARRESEAETQRTAVLAVLRGAMLDLLATGDVERVTRAVHHQLAVATLSSD